MKDVGKFKRHFVYFTAVWYTYCMPIWYILLSFWHIFFRFGMLYQEKSGSPGKK
jgi:hypothetical protein